MDKNSELFISLVSSFQMQVMMHLGKLKNPVSEKVEKDLNSAQLMIDMIDMLKAKTVNNLTEEENNFIDTVLSNMKINFVEESSKDNNTNKPESIQTS